MRRQPAEWEPQTLALIAWPHESTDWGGDLQAAEQTYGRLATEIARRQRLAIVCMDPSHQQHVESQLKRCGAMRGSIDLYSVPYNDTYRVGQLRGDGIAVLFFDLDHFKSVNDTFGHDAGDEVLREASLRLRNTVRKGDSVIRWGGEEFLIILPGADCEAASMVVRRIMDAGLGERPDGVQTTASIGISETRSDKTENWKQLVERADERMYKAKTDGRVRGIGCSGEEILWSA